MLDLFGPPSPAAHVPALAPQGPAPARSPVERATDPREGFARRLRGRAPLLTTGERAERDGGAAGAPAPVLPISRLGRRAAGDALPQLGRASARGELADAARQVRAELRALAAARLAAEHATSVTRTPRGEAERLANLTGNVSAPAEEAPRERDRSPAAAWKERRRRWALMQAARNLTRWGRVTRCGRLAAPGKSPELARDDLGRARYLGVRACGRLWVCPSCAGAIGAERAAELLFALDGHITGEGGAAHQLLTLPHTAGDGLEQTRRLVADAWRSVQMGRPWRQIKSRFGLIGTVRSLELTHGPNGWHPHLHVLLLTERRLTGRERRLLGYLVFRRWRRAIVAAGRQAPLAGLCRISAVSDHARAAAYVTKIAAAHELTRWDNKAPRDELHRNPFDLLRDAARRRSPRDYALWREFEEGMYRAKQHTWSRGLKARFGLDELTDADVAAGEIGERAKIVARLGIPVNAWRTLTRLPWLALAVLEHAESPAAMTTPALVSLIDSQPPEHWARVLGARPPDALDADDAPAPAARPSRAALSIRMGPEAPVWLVPMRGTVNASAA